VRETPSSRPGELEVPALPVGRIREFFVTLGKALRAFQLYDENNPVYQRFAQGLAEAFQGLWDELESLQVVVEENRLLVEGEEVYENPTRSESLAFLFYKDGLRTLTFRPGIEHEAKTFLAVLNQARLARADGDDLITLLWEADLQHLRYRHVDLLAEGLELPEPGPGGTEADFQAILAAESPEDGEEPAAEAAAEGALQPLNREDFNPTLYNLDAREMELLQSAIQDEMDRDVRTEVINGLFDRLEELRPDRQTEIIGILNLLVPALLARGELAAATRVLSELRGIESRDGVLADEHRRAVARLLDRLSSPETLGELVQALEDEAIKPSADLLGGFFGHLRAGALGTLIRAAETTQVRDLKPILRSAVAGIARRNREALVSFLDASDPLVVTGTLHLAGQMDVREVSSRLPDLLYHESPAVRKAAVETVLQLKATTLASRLLDTLLDPEVEVRIAAARALQSMRSRGAAGRLREILQSKEIRAADLSEQIAMFEAYGSVEDPQALAFLDRYLNGKGFLGRREPPEIRACAALALGKLATPEARAALRKSAADDDPVVRNAVGRAMRGMGDTVR
jgi:HEAT repeat protein